MKKILKNPNHQYSTHFNVSIYDYRRQHSPNNVTKVSRKKNNMICFLKTPNIWIVCPGCKRSPWGCTRRTKATLLLIDWKISQVPLWEAHKTAADGDSPDTMVKKSPQNLLWNCLQLWVTTLFLFNRTQARQTEDMKAGKVIHWL